MSCFDSQTIDGPGTVMILKVSLSSTLFSAAAAAAAVSLSWLWLPRRHFDTITSMLNQQLVASVYGVLTDHVDTKDT